MLKIIASQYAAVLSIMDVITEEGSQPLLRTVQIPREYIDSPESQRAFGDGTIVAVGFVNDDYECDCEHITYVHVRADGEPSPPTTTGTMGELMMAASTAPELMWDAMDALEPDAFELV